jgi:hypothetical protein
MPHGYCTALTFLDKNMLTGWFPSAGKVYPFAVAEVMEECQEEVGEMKVQWWDTLPDKQADIAGSYRPCFVSKKTGRRVTQRSKSAKPWTGVRVRIF